MFKWLKNIIYGDDSDGGGDSGQHISSGHDGSKRKISSYVPDKIHKVHKGPVELYEYSALQHSRENYTNKGLMSTDYLTDPRAYSGPKLNCSGFVLPQNMHVGTGLMPGPEFLQQKDGSFTRGYGVNIEKVD